MLWQCMFELCVNYELYANRTAHFYTVIDCRGRHRKGITIYNATYVNLQQTALFE